MYCRRCSGATTREEQLIRRRSSPQVQVTLLPGREREATRRAEPVHPQPPRDVHEPVQRGPPQQRVGRGRQGQRAHTTARHRWVSGNRLSLSLPIDRRLTLFCSPLVVIKLEGGTDEDIKLLDAPAPAPAAAGAEDEKKPNENDEENGGEVMVTSLTGQCAEALSTRLSFRLPDRERQDGPKAQIGRYVPGFSSGCWLCTLVL